MAAVANNPSVAWNAVERDPNRIGFNDPSVDPNDAAVRASNERLKYKAIFVRFLQTAHEVGVGSGETAVIREVVYSDELKKHRKCLTVDVKHLRQFGQQGLELSQQLYSRPTEIHPWLEQACVEYQFSGDVDAAHAGQDADVDTTNTPTPADYGEFQLSLIDSEAITYNSSATSTRGSLRQLTAASLTSLVSVQAIVTSCTKKKHKAVTLTLQCKDCMNTICVTCRPGMGGGSVPSTCPARQNSGAANVERCSLNPWLVLPKRSTYIDQQYIKIQERPEDVPVGELPRTLMAVLDKQLVGSVAPGTRVRLVGVYSVQSGKSQGGGGGGAAVRTPYIRVLGIESEQEEAGNDDVNDEDVLEMANGDDLQQKMFNMIAPNIFGNENIKKAVACLLFGGTRKRMPDGTNRRGDINVLLLGDPSTAKSQFLKFAHRVGPRAVYTSGKGSSAAGLTASVNQHPQTREFFLEGGAMVMADGGVVCIDEFDKMRPEDRVAIHEAMEQQTISVAKAGITTVLNSRTAVLAAANPPSGSYDDLKTAQENIELQSTILSRFDLIFIVKDNRDKDVDLQIARHVLGVHVTQSQGDKAEFERQKREETLFKKYIQLARKQVQPRLTESAGQLLVEQYVDIKKQVHGNRGEEGDIPAVPITVRQLEAMIRVAESFARMQLSNEVSELHVKAAIELFKDSTLDAARSGLHENIAVTEEQRNELKGLEREIRRRVAVRSQVSVARLIADMERSGFQSRDVNRCLVFLCARNEFEFRQQKRKVFRKL